MADYEIRLDGHQEVIAKFKYWVAFFPVLVSRSMQRAARETIVRSAKDNLVASGAIADGDLWRSIQAYIARVSIGDVQVNVETVGIDYGRNVEFGSPPGTEVDIEKLVKWIMTKNDGIPEPIARQIAAKTQETIKQQGTKPDPFLGPAVTTQSSAFVLRTIELINQGLR